jgi:N-acetylmuramoyl-L-alanine amidase
MQIRKLHYLLFLAIVLFHIGCTPKLEQGLYGPTNKSYKKQAQAYGKLLAQYPVKDSAGLKFSEEWVGTTNLNLRKPNLVVIHHTAQASCAQTLKVFTLPRTQVSAHYVICDEGTVYHMLSDHLRAWHAGVGRWGNITDVNSSSIGIEIDNDGSEPFTAQQMESLLILLERLKKAYNIPTANFIAHADIAPTRKNDPSVAFNWEVLGNRGFGLWYNNTEAQARTLPANFDVTLALKILGYDVKEEKAIFKAFRRKFFKTETDTPLVEAEQKVLYDLMLKAL